MNVIEKQQKELHIKQKMFLVRGTHYCISVLLFYGAFLLFRYDFTLQNTEFGFRYNYIVTGLYAAVLAFLNSTLNSYLFGYTRIRGLVLSQFLSQLFSTVIIYIGVSLGWNNLKAPYAFIGLLFIYFFLDCGVSRFGNDYYYKLNPTKRTLLIYRNNRDRRRFGNLTGKPTERLYRIVREIRFDGSFEEIREELENGYDAIFVAGLNSRCRNGILKYCEENDIRGFFLPHIGDVIMQGAEHIQTFDSPVLQARRKSPTTEYMLVKRGFDILGSAAGLIVLSPLMALIALAVWLCDRGPVFYRQTRVTKNGKEFRIIKFRSMRVDAEKDGIARLSTGEKDDRITPVGRILRNYRLDELPQLWNILIGNMSFVGPRPERPEITEQYCLQMPEFKLRLQVKAGLTGYAQVYGKYNTDPYEKLEFDLLYINHMSLVTDLQLLFSTSGILFVKESTSGVRGITAIDGKEEGDS